MSSQITPCGAEHTLAHLRELIEALDRRVPQIESAGEIDIAREAALVRDRALARIREIESAATLDPAGVK